MKKLADRWVRSTARQKELARLALKDLKDQGLEVILIPAPEKKHTGHMIRMATNHNPAWYKEMASRRNSNRPGGGGCGSLRLRVIRALKRLRAGWHDSMSMDEEILEEVEYFHDE